MDAPGRFVNLEALEVAHVQLLEELDRACAGETVASDSESERRFVAANRDRIVAFLAEGARTGAVLHGLAERRPAQQILDRWSACLFRVGVKDVAAASLAPFDENAAPDLAGVPCPYVGLEPFHEDEAGRFYGRKERTRDLVEAVRTRPFVFVTGASGSGKSSLVLAGLLPALRDNAIPGSAGWTLVPTVVPGKEPLRNLARQLATALPALTADGVCDALRADPAGLRALLDAQSKAPCLIVVDQFEEAFAVRSGEADRDAHVFLAALIALADSPGCPHRIVATFRKDREGDLAASERLQQLYFDRPFIVSSMLPEQLRAAIEEPAAQAGLVIEPDVVDALVNTFTADETGLPLLQYCLVELWQRRTRNRVGRKTLADLGDPKHAMAKVADEIYGALSVERQAAVKLVFLQLARKVEGQEFLRARKTRGELWTVVGENLRVDDVIRRFADRRLLRVSPAPSGDPAGDVVEVAHEALLRNWNEFRRWVVEEGSRLDQRTFISRQAAAWAESAAKQDRGSAQDGTGLLLSGIALQQAMADIYDEFPEGSVERRFLDESKRKAAWIDAELTRAADAARKEAQWATERERRKARGLKWLGGVTALVVVLAVGLAVYYYKSRQFSEELVARQVGSAALAACETDPELARRLARHAFDIGLARHPTALHEAVAASYCLLRSPVTRARPMPVPGSNMATAFALAPDGRFLVAGDARGALQEWSIADEVPRGSDPNGDAAPAPIGSGIGVSALAYSPDLAFIAVGKATTDGGIAATGGYGCEKDTSCGEVLLLRRGAAAGGAGAAAPLALVARADAGRVTHVVYSRDGSRLAVATTDAAGGASRGGTLAIFDTAAIAAAGAFPAPLHRQAIATGIARLAPATTRDGFVLVTRTNRATLLQAGPTGYAEQRFRIPECATPASVSAGMGRQLIAQASRVCIFAAAEERNASVHDEGNVLAALLRGNDDVLITLAAGQNGGADVIVRHLAHNGDVVVLHKAFDVDTLAGCANDGGGCMQMDGLLQASGDGRTLAAKPVRGTINVYRLGPQSDDFAWLRHREANIAFGPDDRYFGVLERGADAPGRRTFVYRAIEAATGKVAWRAEIDDDEPALPSLVMIDATGERFVVQGPGHYRVWRAGATGTPELDVATAAASLYPLPGAGAFGLLRRDENGAGTGCDLFRLAAPGRPGWSTTEKLESCEFYEDGSVAVVLAAQDGTRRIVVHGTAGRGATAQIAGVAPDALYYMAGTTAKHLLVATPTPGHAGAAHMVLYALREGLAKVAEYDGPSPTVTDESPRAFAVDPSGKTLVVTENEGRLTQRALAAPGAGTSLEVRTLDVSGRHGVAVAGGKTSLVTMDDDARPIAVETGARIEFSPGSRFALATHRNRAVVYDLVRRAPVAELPFPVQEARFSTAGTHLVARTPDGTYILPLTVADLPALIAAGAPPMPFTDAERCRYESDAEACKRQAGNDRASTMRR